MTDFKQIEFLLNNLLVSVEDIFSTPELTEVSEFVEAAEYGVALETFVDIVKDESKQISSVSLEIASELSIAMKMDNKKIRGQLSEHIHPLTITRDNNAG